MNYAKLSIRAAVPLHAQRRALPGRPGLRRAPSLKSAREAC